MRNEKNTLFYFIYDSRYRSQLMLNIGIRSTVIIVIVYRFDYQINAPITYVDVKHSFFMYEYILFGNGLSFTTNDLTKYMVVNFF